MMDSMQFWYCMSIPTNELFCQNSDARQTSSLCHVAALVLLQDYRFQHYVTYKTKFVISVQHNIVLFCIHLVKMNPRISPYANTKNHFPYLKQQQLEKIIKL